MGDAIRAIARLAILLVILLACLIAYLLALPFGRSRVWIRRFLRAAGHVLGADVRIIGQPLDRDVLFVANHLSWFDILALGGATGCAFVSKAAVARWPVVGWLARIGGTVFVAPTSRADVHAQADALARALGTGRPVALFPEGTTNDGTGLLPFRAALFSAATAAGAAVQPIAVDFGPLAPEIAWGADESAPAVARRLIGRRGRIPITLHVLPPIAMPGADRKALAAAARDAIRTALAGLPPGRTIPYSARP